jgi:hypothetical protein
MNVGNNAQAAFVHCVNGLIVEVTSAKPSEGKIPDGSLVHQLLRDRVQYREALSKINNSILGFRRQEEKEAEKSPLPINISLKTVELLDKIIDDVDRVKTGKPVGLV